MDADGDGGQRHGQDQRQTVFSLLPELPGGPEQGQRRGREHGHAHSGQYVVKGEINLHSGLIAEKGIKIEAVEQHQQGL